MAGRLPFTEDAATRASRREALGFKREIMHELRYDLNKRDVLFLATRICCMDRWVLIFVCNSCGVSFSHKTIIQGDQRHL